MTILLSRLHSCCLQLFYQCDIHIIATKINPLCNVDFIANRFVCLCDTINELSSGKAQSLVLELYIFFVSKFRNVKNVKSLFK